MVCDTNYIKDNGELTKGPSEVSDSWLQHFKKVLNVRSIYDLCVLDAFPVSLPVFYLGDLPLSLKMLYV